MAILSILPAFQFQEQKLDMDVTMGSYLLMEMKWESARRTAVTQEEPQPVNVSHSLSFCVLFLCVLFPRELKSGCVELTKISF